MQRRRRPEWKNRALAAGLAVTLLAAATSCQSTEQETVAPPPPQISAPLDDGGFQNLATNRALTPEEWARLMGYPDISDNAALDEGEDANIQLEGLEPVLDAGEQTSPVLEDGTSGHGITEEDNEVLEFEPEAENGKDGLPDGQRIIDETEEGVVMMPEDIIPDLGYESGDVFLAGEEETAANDNQTDVPVIEQGEVHIIEEPEAVDTGDGMDPGVIEEMAAASANRPGEATIATFIMDHFAYVFLGAFGLLAILIFAAMSRFASSGDETAMKIKRKKKQKKASGPKQAETEFDMGPLPSGKSFVFSDEKDGRRPEDGTSRQTDGDSGDELELEPVDGIPDYDTKGGKA